jgi:hypothetical protein
LEVFGFPVFIVVFTGKQSPAELFGKVVHRKMRVDEERWDVKYIIRYRELQRRR